MMSRAMELDTPLGPDTLLFRSLHGDEELGHLFEYRIEALSLKNTITPEELLGKSITVKLQLPTEGGSNRYFNGYVTNFGLDGVSGRYYVYSMVVRPWFWILSRRVNCRIFQNLSVPDIVKKIFGEYGVAVFDASGLTDSYRTWEYCVQYRESDFNFISRLLEHEGIYYYFKHEDGKHTLKLVDSPSKHEPFPEFEKFPFINHGGARPEQDFVSDWNFSCEIHSGIFAHDDYDFKKPKTELLVKKPDPRKHDESKHEYYDYPGLYTTNGDGEHYARARLDEIKTQYRQTTGGGNPRAISTGYVFELTGHPRGDQNRKYLVERTHYDLYFDQYEASGGGEAHCHCMFAVKPGDEQFRPARLTLKPRVHGSQTAVVVGPKGDEIYVDKFGRVKVQFHWDREGKFDENSSCWMRVSHPWAGKNWGMIAIPRIGQEVIVDFLEGDPDQPVITGRVYNADQMPPYDLPANMTQTGIKTRSSKGGSGANANEIRFEDKMGEEHLLIHAEKDQMIEVEHDETHSVGHDRTKTVEHNETTEVKNDRTETVGNNETITIKNDRTETVKGNETISITKDRKETVEGNETIAITKDRTETVQGKEKVDITGTLDHTITGAATYTSPTSIKLVVGGSTVEVTPSGITLSFGGSSVKVDAMGVALGGPKISLNG